MKKLKLDVDALQINSFQTGYVQIDGGSLQGDSTVPGCPAKTAQFTCVPTS